MGHVVSQCKSLILKVQPVPVIFPKYSRRVRIHGGYIAVTVMAFSCLGILGMWKPLTQGGQVLVLDEILGNTYKFIPCLCWIIVFSILQEYFPLSCLIVNSFPHVACKDVSGAGTSFGTAEGCWGTWAVVVEVGSSISPTCALSLPIGYLCECHFPYIMCWVSLLAEVPTPGWRHSQS